MRDEKWPCYHSGDESVTQLCARWRMHRSSSVTNTHAGIFLCGFARDGDFAGGDNMTSTWVRSSLCRFLRDESGNVESALVLIPLLILVLSTLQISMGTLSRIVASNVTQSGVTQRSLSSLVGATSYFSSATSTGTSDSNGLSRSSGSSPSSITSLNRVANSEIPLSGGGVLYLDKETHRLPSLTPLLPDGDIFTSIGVSVGESP
jgi:hypothetical protein